MMAMEKICKNCKNFEPDRNIITHGRCSKLDMETSLERMEDNIEVISDSPYDILIGNNFGCIHFESKEQ